MRRSLSVGALSFVLAVGVAGAAWAEAFTISLSSPGSGAVLFGNVTVRIEYQSSGETPTNAAFLLSTDGSWSGDGTALSPSGQGFQTSFDSNWVPNGSYTLIARAWGGGVDHSDSTSYAQATTTVKVNNAPPAPTGLAASGSDGTVTITWDPDSSRNRSDFQGYQVYRAAASGTSCPGAGSYVSRGAVSSATYTEGGVTSNYCYAVVTKRSSPQSGTITSDFSAPVVANGTGEVSGGGGGGGNGGGGGGNGGGGGGNGGGNGGPVTYVRFGRAGGSSAPAPPEAPEVREVIPDDGFSEHLPYSPVSVEEFNRIVSEGSGISGGLVGSTDARHRAMTLVAAGLLLGVSAMQIRRFVSG